MPSCANPSDDVHWRLAKEVWIGVRGAAPAEQTRQRYWKGQRFTTRQRAGERSWPLPPKCDVLSDQSQSKSLRATNEMLLRPDWLGEQKTVKASHWSSVEAAFPSCPGTDFVRQTVLHYDDGPLLLVED